MADLSITAANVGIGNLGSPVKPVIVGEAVSHGQPGYLIESTGKYMQADANDGEAKSIVSVLFLGSASGDGEIVLAAMTGALIKLGAVLSPTVPYYLSHTKGSICLASDLASNDWVTLIGHAKSTSLLEFVPHPLRVQVP